VIKMSEIEERLTKIERNNLAFRIGAILSLFGLLLLVLDEMSLYNGTILVLQWTSEMALYIGGFTLLFGFGLVIIATLTFEKVYGIGE